MKERQEELRSAFTRILVTFLAKIDAMIRNCLALLIAFSCSAAHAGVIASFEPSGGIPQFSDDYFRVDTALASTFNVELRIAWDGVGNNEVRYFDFDLNIVDVSGTAGGLTFATATSSVQGDSEYVLGSAGARSSEIESATSNSARVRDGVAEGDSFVRTMTTGTDYLLARLTVNVDPTIEIGSEYRFELTANASNRNEAAGGDNYVLDIAPVTFVGLGADDMFGGTFNYGSDLTTSDSDVRVVPEPNSLIAIALFTPYLMLRRRKRAA